MNALELITKSFYLGGIVSKDYEEINDTQLDDGIFWLNVVSSEKKIRSGAIPYRFDTGNEYTLAEGVEIYNIPDLVSLSSLTFTDSNNLRYGIQKATYNEYFNSGRVNNTVGRPTLYYAKPESFGMKIYVFPLPDKEYTLNIDGKFALSKRSIETLQTEYLYDDFFLGLMLYEIAKKLDHQYDEVWTPEKEQELSRIRKIVYAMTGIDMSKNRGSFNVSTTAFGLTLSQGWSRTKI